MGVVTRVELGGVDVAKWLAGIPRPREWRPTIHNGGDIDVTLISAHGGVVVELDDAFRLPTLAGDAAVAFWVYHDDDDLANVERVASALDAVATETDGLPDRADNVCVTVEPD